MLKSPAYAEEAIMANRYFRQFALVKDPRTILLGGQISLSAAAAVTGNTLDFVQSVTKSATGEYTIILQDKYVIDKTVQVSFEGASLCIPKIKSVDLANKTIIVQTMVAGAVADITAAGFIHLLAFIKDSTVS